VDLRFCQCPGGKLIIGKNDKGDCVGLKDAKKLLADIPNKIRDILGIIADVNLKQEAEKEYLEIAVDPYPSPVNYRGEYYYRTGSTKQELKGQALDSFLLKKYGLHWDGVPHPHLKIGNLEDRIFALFLKKGLQCGRLESSSEHDTKEQVCAKLNLFDGSYLKRAAALLFCEEPEQFITGAYVKIGFFRTVTDLLYQDEIRGNIFAQVDRTVELLTTKYMKAYIHYEGIQRVERFLAPKEALREAVTNAIVHKDYAGANPIQIKVYEDKVIIWNTADIPEELPIERLLGSHPSIPYNPLLAAAFFRAGYIESWGRGIEKIKAECKMADAPEPKIEYDFGGVQVTFTGEVPVTSETKISGEMSEKSTLKTPESTLKTPESTLKTPESTLKTSVKILEIIENDKIITLPKIAEKLGLTTWAIKKQMNKLQAKGIIKRIGPDKGGHWEVIEKKS
jgi:ATP-dependent DNA helicase RecG